MQVTLEKTGELDGIIKVDVVQDDYIAKVNQELKEIGRERVIPGFRRGHVSLEQLRRRFGKEVKSHVLNEEVYRAVIDYIRENKVNILGEPLPVEVKEISLDQPDYTFEYEIGYAPEISAPIDDTLTLPYYTIAVDDKLVAERKGQHVGLSIMAERAKRIGAAGSKILSTPNMLALMEACALELARTGGLTDAAGLAPVYHRLSQAERERLARLGANAKHPEEH